MSEPLIEAIRQKDLRRVEELLAAGADPNWRSGDQTAYQWVPHGAREIKCALIEAGAEDPELTHALVWVIGTGRVRAVQVLIDRGADVNVSTHSGTPIQVAARAGQAEIVDLLIGAGADVDAGSGITTPLLSALEGGYAEIGLKLIGAGADPELTPKYGEMKPIAMAATLGNAEVMRALIGAGAAVDIRVSQITINRRALQQEAVAGLQAAFGAMESLGRMMDSLEDMDDEAEVSPRQVAEIEGEITQLRSQRRRRPTTEPENAVDVTPVILAARCGHGEVLAALLEAGADPHAKDGEGLSAYDWAVRRDHQSVLAVLQRFGVTGNRIDVNENVILAADTGDLEGVRQSLAQGADVNARDQRRQTRGKTPLMLASRAGHLASVRCLLEAGADPNLTDREPEAQPLSGTLLAQMNPRTLAQMGYSLDQTALMMVAKAGQTEIGSVLLQAGADPNLTDARGYSPLALAAENNCLAIAQALVAAGAEIDRATSGDETPLSLACGRGKTEVAQFLIDQGADIHKTNRDGETPLIKAAAAIDLDLVRSLIDRGADVNVVTKDRISTALGAVTGASVEVEADEDDTGPSLIIISDQELQTPPEDRILGIVQVLLQAGADPNMPNCDETPLANAARNNHPQVLKRLLESGAKVEVRDSSGDTAVSIAKLYQHREMLDLLRKYVGADLSQYERMEPEDDEEDIDQWGEELPIPDFSERAQDPEYQQAVRELAEICGSTAVPYGEIPGYYSIHVNTKRRSEISAEVLQQQFLERGCFVYQPDYFHGSEGPECLAVLPTTDKYEVIAVHQTNGCNYDIGPGHVVEWLRDLEERHPFILTCIAHDTLAGRFLDPIDDAETLAEEMYKFCPDIVDQGCDSVESLVESLASSDQLFFWWD